MKKKQKPAKRGGSTSKQLNQVAGWMTRHTKKNWPKGASEVLLD